MRIKPPLNGKIRSDISIEEYFTKKEVLKYFRVGESIYKQWIKKGLLKPIRKGSLYLYRTADIIRLLKKFEKNNR